MAALATPASAAVRDGNARFEVLTPTLMTWVHTLRYDPMIEASLLMMATVMIPALLAVLLLTAGSRVLRSSTR